MTRRRSGRSDRRTVGGAHPTCIFAAVTDAAPPIAEIAPPPKPFTLPLPGLFVFLACLALALLGNSGSLRGENFIGAETTLIRDNDLLNRLPGLQAIWFRGTAPETYPLPQYAPLAQTMFFVEHSLWSDLLWPYRLVSIVLHALAGLMVWRLLRSLNVPGAIVAAMIFVAHPTTVDSISWVAERRVPLASVLALSGAFVLLRAGGVILPSSGKVKLLPDDPFRLYAIGAVLLVLSLFSSAAIGTTVPLVVLLIGWWKQHKADARLAATCVALLVAGVAMLSLSSSIEKARAGVLTPAAWNRASTDAGELVTRAQIAGRAIVFYAAKLVVPYPIAVDYPRWQTPRDVEQFRTFTADPSKSAARTADVGPGQVIAYAYPLLVVAVVVAAWCLRKRFGRGPVLVVVAFTLLLAPSLGFVDLGWMRYSFVANRALYLASVPLIAGLVWIGNRLLAMANDPTVTVSSAALVIALFAVLSAVNVARRFENASKFWLANANASTRSWWPRYELALSLLHYPDPAAFKQAITAVEDVRRLKPDEPAAIVLAGLFRQRDGDEAGAVLAFEKSIDTFPGYAPAYYEVADSFRVQAEKKPTDPLPRLRALEYYRKAAALDPFDARSRVQFGRTAWEIAKRLNVDDPTNAEKFVDEATKSFDEAIELRPYDVDLLVTISKTLIEMGKLAPAGSLLETARSIAPTRADVYEAIADASLARRPSDINGADVSLRLAISLDPKSVTARVKLGTLRQVQERWREAKRLFETALELDPKNAEAKRRLAEVETSATTRPESPTTRP
jgi:protein O-mannosyl-transferase